MPSVAYLYELYDSYYLHLVFEMAQGYSVEGMDDAHDEDNSGDDGTLGSSPNGMDYSTYSNSNRTMSTEDNPTMYGRMANNLYPIQIPKARRRYQTTHL